MRVKRRKPEQHFKTEAELCAAFAKVSEAAGWTVYAETAGWDQLLVDADGQQIGVQAKLRPNIAVLHQAIEYDHPERHGPDFRAVLVGSNDAAFEWIARRLRLICIAPQWGKEIRFPTLAAYEDFRRAPKQRHKLPEFVPDVPAGVPCPVQLTAWKVKAIRLCAVLRSQGYVTRADFKRFGLDYRRWFSGEPSWLRCEQDGRWVPDGKRLPDEDHPKVAAEIMRQVKAELETASTTAS